jgi:hypothetical protein
MTGSYAIGKGLDHCIGVTVIDRMPKDLFQGFGMGHAGPSAWCFGAL